MQSKLVHIIDWLAGGARGVAKGYLLRARISPTHSSPFEPNFDGGWSPCAYWGRRLLEDFTIRGTVLRPCIQHNLLFWGTIRDHPPKKEIKQQSALETYHTHYIAVTCIFFTRIYDRIYEGTEGSFICTMSHYLRHPTVTFARFVHIICWSLDLISSLQQAFLFPGQVPKAIIPQEHTRYTEPFATLW